MTCGDTLCFAFPPHKLRGEEGSITKSKPKPEERCGPLLASDSGHEKRHDGG